MAILKFRGIPLAEFEQLEVKDPNTRYIVLNPDGTVYGEYIGDELIGVKASDFESSIEDLELETERLDNEIEEVEQKTDEHIVDMNNPHGVTAEQVGTYDKAAIDLKDTNILQEAKDYTYSRVEIDNKDTSTLQEAKDYADDKISEIAGRLYGPDEVTIVFDEEGKLKVSENLEIDGGYL